MKVLVTGGAGFIGSHLAIALVQRGHRVRVLDNFQSGKRDNLRAVAADVEVVEGDCADGETARRAVKDMDAVLHEAAIPSVVRSIADPALSHRANATGTLSMLLAARDLGVRRFVYAGSSSVYGDQPGRRKREDMDPRPLSPYAVQKLTGEQYTRIFATLSGMETVTLRYFNVFGPHQDAASPYSGVMGLFITALIDGRTPVIYGDGRQSRDFTYVDNVVDANLRALEARGLKGQAVNVATGRAVTLNALLQTLSRIVKRRARAKHVKARPGDIRHSLADISRAQRLLGYRPQVDLRTGLERTVEWYRTHSRSSATR